jgi:hypothetical protein
MFNLELEFHIPEEVWLKLPAHQLRNKYKRLNDLSLKRQGKKVLGKE